MQIKGKIAIVTGASGGIGLATAKLLTQKGARVALVARSKTKLDKISRELTGSFAVVCDLSQPGQVKRMADKVIRHYGGVDILVNNAGQGYDAPVTATNIKTLKYIFSLDVIGPLVAMQKIIPVMKKSGKGAIVNLSSGTALMILPNMGAYSGLKRALTQISLTANEELKKDHISVSVVYPYITDTDFEKNTLKEKFEWEDNGDIPFPPDPPRLVAEIIVKAINTGTPELFAHDWMRPDSRI